MRPLLRYLAAYPYWAMEQGTCQRLSAVFTRHLAGEKLTSDQRSEAIGRQDGTPHPDSLAYQVTNGVAIVPVRGVIAKYSADVNGTSQPEGTSAEKIQAQLRMAATDVQVRAIVLAIDSPGGTVAGTPDTAALISEVSRVMPIVAHIEDLGASAAYWLASQCSCIYANSNAMVGSIGVITRMVDTSEMAKKAGAQVTVIRSVAQKAPGQPGEKITAEQVAEVTRMVASMHDQFTAAVKSGRGFDAAQLAAVTTGQMWVAPEALGLGLIDGICSLHDLVDQLAGRQP